MQLTQQRTTYSLACTNARFVLAKIKESASNSQLRFQKELEILHNIFWQNLSLCTWQYKSYYYKNSHHNHANMDLTCLNTATVPK